MGIPGSGAWVGGRVAWFSFLPVVYVPRLFKMRGNPWSASAAMLANLHLICTFRASILLVELRTLLPHSLVSSCNSMN